MCHLTSGLLHGEDFNSLDIFLAVTRFWAIARLQPGWNLAVAFDRLQLMKSLTGGLVLVLHGQFCLDDRNRA